MARRSKARTLASHVRFGDLRCGWKHARANARDRQASRSGNFFGRSRTLDMRGRFARGRHFRRSGLLERWGEAHRGATWGSTRGARLRLPAPS